MTWRVDHPVRVGANVFAAIVETRIAIHPTRRALVGHGEKSPVAYMWLRDDTISGLDIDGKSLSRDEIERRYPNAIERLDTALSSEE